MKYFLFIWMLLPFAGYSQGNAALPPQKDIAAYRSYLWGHLPEPGGWVNDYEGILNGDEESALQERIDSLMGPANVQFCIVTIDTMAVTRERFDSLIRHIANVWGVGQKGINNGITIGISKGYRCVRICNGRGIETRLTDAATKKIIDTQMIPCFRKAEYYNGLLLGLNALAAQLSARK